MLACILAAAAAFLAVLIAEKTGCVGRLADGPLSGISFVTEKRLLLVLYLVPYLIVALDVIVEAVEKVAHGQLFDEDFLMVVASVAALVIGEYEEAVAVVIFFKIGELFESYAVNRSRKSISGLMDICPEYANVEEDGALTQVDPDEVEIDTVITILPGERIPLDGVVVEGTSMIDTSALTGESVPRSAGPGDDVISGCVNGSGVLKVRTTKEFDDSTVSRILELVENASSRKAPVENFITRFAKIYTPTVVILALAMAVIPALVTGEWYEWIHRACTFLVISCPCALVISVPMGFFGGIGAASSQGILVKGSNFLEAFYNVDTLVLDKTGTITNGVFKVTKVWPAEGFTGEKVLELAAAAEQYSTHPIARSVAEAVNGKVPESITEYEEIAGFGVKAFADGKQLLAGNEKLMKECKIVLPDEESLSKEQRDHLSMSTVVYVAYDGAYTGRVDISDVVKDGVEEAFAELRKAGVKRLIMLTGDRKSVGEAVALQLGMDRAYTQLLPQDKVSRVEELVKESTSGKGKVAFVGDGINDAPVIARADVGIAMGSMGSDAAIEAADIVLMDDRLEKLAVAKRIAGKTLRIVKENIWFALGVKFLVLLLGALGLANMWAAVFADVGVSVIAILNSMRALKSR